MPVIKVDVVLQKVSQIPRDEIKSTFVTFADALDNATVNAINAAVASMYNTSRADGALRGFISDRVTRLLSVHETRFTDITTHLDGSAAGPPQEVRQWFMDAADATALELPSEIAAVATLYGSGRDTAQVEAPDGSRPKARRTGHLYFGALSVNSLGLVGSDTRFSDAFCRCLRDSVLDLAQDLLAIPGGGMQVWSRVNASLTGVVGGHVDNAPDVQRRRGVDATQRQTFTV